jgi:hypothetical protein
MLHALKSCVVFCTFVTTLALATLCSGKLNAAPIINSISGINDQQVQTIDLLGNGFGTLAPYIAQSNNHIIFDDRTRGFSAGFAGLLPAGCCGNPSAGFANDLYTLTVSLWSDSEIIVGGLQYNGFANVFGTLANGDLIDIYVFNAQTNEGPGHISCIVGAGGCSNGGVAAVPEPSSLALIGSAICILALLLFGQHRRRQFAA